MHIYAFGSICRGDVSPSSDVDLLAIVEGHDARFSPDEYSIYSYRRIDEIWEEGNPFAWHLSNESKLVYSSDQSDFLATLGKPASYKNCRRDCEKFYALFREAQTSLESDAASIVFDLSMVFLAVRNFSTCYSLGVLPKPDFSRSAALRIGGDSLSIEPSAYEVLERARMLSTRGVGNQILETEARAAFKHFPCIDEWMSDLLRRVP
jgi:Nucleotidyltransferase domain